jgi:hypothetical protein
MHSDHWLTLGAEHAFCPDIIRRFKTKIPKGYSKGLVV